MKSIYAIIKKIKDFIFGKKLTSNQLLDLIDKDKQTLKIIDRHLEIIIQKEILKRKEK